MPLVAKQQLLVKEETVEGVSANPGAVDAILAYDVTCEDETDTDKQRAAGPTLSRDFAAVGRQTRRITFKTDFRGSGDTSIPITPPDWAQLLRSSGYKVATLVRVTLGTVTGSGFQVGEQITQSSGTIRGVIVGAFSAANAVIRQATTSGDYLVVGVLVGTFTAAASVGVSSSSSSTASAVAAYAGYGLQPTSEKTMRLQVDTWSAATPAVGDVLAVYNPSSQRIGDVQIIVDNGSMLDFDCTLLWGTVANGDAIFSPTGSETEVNAAPVQVKTTSLTMRRNLDGRRKELVGSRGDYTLSGEVGSPLKFEWRFAGDIGPTINTPALVTTGLSTIKPPRLLGAQINFGIGANLLRLPVKSITMNGNQTVSPNLDANRAGGSTGSNVTDRDPGLQVVTDNTNGAADWEAMLASGDPVRVSIIVGSTPGNIVSLTIPIAQVMASPEGDSEGVSTHTVTFEPRRINESGDDDVWFVQM